MPTTSQNQIISRVVDESHNKNCRIVKQVSLPDIQEVSLVEQQKWKDANLDGHRSSLPVTSEDVQQLDVEERLHSLGFWKGNSKKFGVIKIPSTEDPIMEQQVAEQYSKEIIEEVEKEVERKIKSPVKKKKRRPPPEKKPAAITFEYRGSSTNHKEVLDKMRSLIKYRRGSSIVSVQFLPPSQWIVTTDSVETRNSLYGVECYFGSEKLALRYYDDVMKTTYKKYLRKNGLIDMINN